MHNIKKAHCKNGEHHKLYDVFPIELGIGKKRCSCCNETIVINEQEHKKAVERYFNNLPRIKNISFKEMR